MGKTIIGNHFRPINLRLQGSKLALFLFCFLIPSLYAMETTFLQDFTLNCLEGIQNKKT